MIVGIVAGQVGEDVCKRVIDMVLPRDSAPVVLAVLDRGGGKRGREFKDGAGW
jgi:hypothetical protein